ncbi:MAG: hypothetical protein FWF85_06840, partial [Clostridiales bacterium]|nr:hypothetical protein [Clostridiales bacterium]
MCQLNLCKITPNVIPDLIRDPLLASGVFRVKSAMTGKRKWMVLDVTAYWKTEDRTGSFALAKHYFYIYPRTKTFSINPPRIFVVRWCGKTAGMLVAFQGF